MKNAIVRFVAAVILIIVAAMIQGSDFLNIFGLKPNILLVLLVVLIPMVGGLFEYLALVLLSAFLVKFGQGFEFSSFSLAIVALLAYFLNYRMPWTQFLNTLALILAATLLFYAIVSLDFLISDYRTVITESVYNLILGSVFYLILNDKKETRIKF